MAFSARSSLAALPAMLEGARTRLSVHRDLPGFFLPISASIFRPGSAVAIPVGAVFVALQRNIGLCAGQRECLCARPRVEEHEHPREGDHDQRAGADGHGGEHPVTDRPLHVDFLRISEHASVHVNVPIVFTDEEESAGIKRGGVLNIVRHELELVVDAAEIPDQIEISLKGVDVGDSIHISAVTLPKGATPAITDRDFTIATVVAPSALKSSEGDTQTEVGEAEGE